MRKISNFSATIGALLFLSLALPFHAGAQDQGNRGLKLKKTVGATPEEAAKGPVQLWALIIGISNYKYGDQEIDGMTIANLAYATTDAKSVYDFLQSDAGGGFRDVSKGGHMILLQDEEATKSNIEAQLNSLKEAKPNDYFVIYVAGHGHIVTRRAQDSVTGVDEAVPYFVVHDTNPRDFKGTAVDMRWFSRTVEHEIPARRGLVLLDTCHSGGIVLPGTRGGEGEPTNQEFIGELKKIQGIGFIAAAGVREYSFEKPDIDHGVFTYCLLAALRGAADEDKDGIVNFDEALEYLLERVPMLTDGRQHPYYFSSTLSAHDIPLSLVRYPGKKPEGPAKYATLVIHNPAVDGVEVAIDDEPSQSAPAAVEFSTQVSAGAHKIVYSQNGASKSKLQVTLDAGETKEVEIKLCFSEIGEQDKPEGLPDSLYLPDKEPSQEAKDLFHNGVDTFNRQKFKEAYDLFNRAIRANGGAYSRALVYRGRTEQSLGRRKEAVASFNEALRLKPTDFETQTLLAEARFDGGGDVQEVYNELRYITTTYPRYAFAHVVLGDVLLWRGEKIRAERELRRAVALDPKSPPAHLILANALTYQAMSGKQKEAVKEAEEALRLFEDLSHKRVTFKGSSISHLIFGGGRYADAPAMAEAHYMLAKALTRAVEGDPTLAERKVYLDRARVSIQEATRLAQSLHDKNRLAQLLVTSAQNYLLKEDVTGSIRDGEEALRLSDSPLLEELRALAHHILFQAYGSNQKCAKAAEHLRAYIDIYQSHMTSAEHDQYNAELQRLKNCADAHRQD